MASVCRKTGACPTRGCWRSWRWRRPASSSRWRTMRDRCLPTTRLPLVAEAPGPRRRPRSMHASASSLAAPLILLPFDAATQAATHGSTHGPAQDQAAGLRALFARPCVRVLPVIVPSEPDQTRTVWLAKLAEAFARHGERTLVLDTLRAQGGAAFRLRARHDLEHALTRQCSLAAG